MGCDYVPLLAELQKYVPKLQLEESTVSIVHILAWSSYKKTHLAYRVGAIEHSIGLEQVAQSLDGPSFNPCPVCEFRDWNDEAAVLWPWTNRRECVETTRPDIQNIG